MNPITLSQKAGRQNSLSLTLRIARSILAVAGLTAAASAFALPVEDKFKVPGPSKVVQTSAMDYNDKTYTIYYPWDIDTDGYLNPVITWGNGTGQTCLTEASSAPMERHLASWGFVVVCADTTASGWGTEIIAAAQYLVTENARQGSIFYNKLDTTRIGAAGHSQGANGVVNANTKSSGLIKSTLAMALPDSWWANPASQAADVTKVTGPIFFDAGCTDWITSKQADYYNKVTGPAAKACVRGAGHEPMMVPSQAYGVAWFKYTLRGDAFARSAFVTTGGVAPEVGRSALWTSWAGKNLP